MEEALGEYPAAETERVGLAERALAAAAAMDGVSDGHGQSRSLKHISEPTRPPFGSRMPTSA